MPGGKNLGENANDDGMALIVGYVSLTPRWKGRKMGRWPRTVLCS